MIEEGKRDKMRKKLTEEEESKEESSDSFTVED
jgi:hypothetical protein